MSFSSIYSIPSQSSLFPTSSIFHALRLRNEVPSKPFHNPQLFQEKILSNYNIPASLSLSKYKLEGHDGCVNTISFSATGELVVTGSDDTTVKIWNSGTRKCVQTLEGHLSNVFSAHLIDFKDVVVSGGNDSDIRLFNIEKQTCTVYSHHSKKVLRITLNPENPNVFYSCSADSTIRRFDIREKYAHTHTSNSLPKRERGAGRFSDSSIIPQAMGGGRRSATAKVDAKYNDSLIVDYKCKAETSSSTARNHQTLYSVDVNPKNPNLIIVGSSDGNVRLFDVRKIINWSHEDYVNIYRNIEIGNGNECTGCNFNYDGTKIIATNLGEQIYMYDTNKNFERDDAVDYVKRLQRRRTTQQTQEGTTASTTTDSSTESVGKPDVQTYERMFKGHKSFRTIKGVYFWGPHSEYVVSGSDDAKIYIWESKTGKLLQILEGHDDIVNNIAFHPTYPMIATSGIDDYVNIWEPEQLLNIKQADLQEELSKRERHFRTITEANEAGYRRTSASSDDDEEGSIEDLLSGLSMQQVLALFNMMQRSRQQQAGGGAEAQLQQEEDE